MIQPGTAVLAQHASWMFIFAHPGHELRAHRIVELTRPTVTVMTDGSGASNASRLDQTRELLAQAGARTGSVFGAMTDREAYRSLMDADSAPFRLLVDRVAAELELTDATAVVVDAAEGFNPVHDVCHWIGRAAIARAERRGRRIEAFELDLARHPDQDGRGVRVCLDDDAFARKIDAANRYRALAVEAASAYSQFGIDAFRVEFLRRLPEAVVPPAHYVPSYEEVGEARVRAGRYLSVLRFATHVRPVLKSLAMDVQTGASATIDAGIVSQ